MFSTPTHPPEAKEKEDVQNLGHDDKGRRGHVPCEAPAFLRRPHPRLLDSPPTSPPASTAAPALLHLQRSILLGLTPANSHNQAPHFGAVLWCCVERAAQLWHSTWSTTVSANYHELSGTAHCLHARASRVVMHATTVSAIIGVALHGTCSEDCVRSIVCS